MQQGQQGIELTYKDNFFIPFENFFGWIFVITFSSNQKSIAQVEDHTILKSLMDHPNYQYGFDKPFNPNEIDTGIHGPYTSKDIKTNDYHASSFITFEQECNEWLYKSGYSPPNEENLRILQVFIERISEHQTSIYKLLKSRDDSEHEFGWILFEFEEYVIIDYSNNDVFLLVWGLD